MYDILICTIVKGYIAMAKKKLPPLSRAETQILRLVWHLENATVQQVCDKLPAVRKITYATVQTLLRRLEKKGYLRHKRRGKAYVFYPAVNKKDVIKRNVAEFVDRLFGGDPVPLIHHLAENSGISKKDIKRLRQLLTEKK